jgi:F0F1-type ATP synthase epsilon subunit
MPDGLHLLIRTPHDVVLDTTVRSVRVPTDTGLVGLRPRGEPQMLQLEAGLVVIMADGGRRFAATAGGLLESTREQATLYTPFAVVGDDPETVAAALTEAQAAPNSELAARRRLGELEQRVLQEVRERTTGSRGRRTGVDA